MPSLKEQLNHLNIFKDLVQVVRDIVDDQRIPASVREEVMDKVNSILESRRD